MLLKISLIRMGNALAFLFDAPNIGTQTQGLVSLFVFFYRHDCLEGALTAFVRN